MSIIVTGGSRGIGFYIAKNLAKKFPGKVIATARKKETCSKTVEKLKKEFDVDVKSHPLDLNSENSIKEFVSIIEKEYGKVKILVNNAGVGIHMAPGVWKEATSSKAAKTTFQVNFSGTVMLTRLLVPFFEKNGTVVSVGSYAACAPKDSVKEGFSKCTKISEIQKLLDEYINENKEKKSWSSTYSFGYGFPLYGMSKLALAVGTRILAKEIDEDEILKKKEITICVCHPGFTKTDMTCHNPNALPTEEGSVTPVFLAVQNDKNTYHGKFFRNKNVEMKILESHPGFSKK